MSRYIALLRAINVGGHNVKMDKLRTLFEEVGVTNVETFIASGNVIFHTPRRDTHRLQSDLAAHLRDSLGYDVATFLRTPSEIDAVANLRPFGAEDGRALYAGFIAEAPDASATEALMSLRNETNDFKVIGREIYWTMSGNVSDSGISNAVIERKLRAPATFRNITTVRKLAAKYGK